MPVWHGEARVENLRTNGRPGGCYPSALWNRHWTYTVSTKSCGTAHSKIRGDAHAKVTVQKSRRREQSVSRLAR